MKRLLFLVTALFSMTATAGQYADELGACLVQNAKADDKKVLTQWAFVTLGQTSAAKEVTTIPTSKIKSVNDRAQTVVLRLMAGCAKPALKATLYEGKNGLTGALKYVAGNMMQEELKKQTSDRLFAKLATLTTP